MRVLVCGAGGFIGTHLVERLRREGHFVVGVDLKRPEFGATAAQEFHLADLRNKAFVDAIFAMGQFDEVYQLAADMGGAGYVFTGENDAEILHNSATINLNVLDACKNHSPGRVFYSSSACIYPARNQVDANAPDCREDSAYPAEPDSEYGWEKLFSERAYMTYARNHALTCRIGRYHNIFGPLGSWKGGREKAPAAICRKVAEARDRTSIEVWGDGQQTRSFLYVDECVEGTLRLMRSEVAEPLNIGSDEMVSIDDLVAMTCKISGKSLAIDHIAGPVGVRGRTSSNILIKERLGWAPGSRLIDGMTRTFHWIDGQVKIAADKFAAV